MTRNTARDHSSCLLFDGHIVLRGLHTCMHYHQHQLESLAYPGTWPNTVDHPDGSWVEMATDVIMVEFHRPPKIR